MNFPQKIKYILITVLIGVSVSCQQSPQFSAIFRGDTPIRFSITAIEMTENDVTTIALSLLSAPTSQVKIPLIVGDDSEVEINVGALFFDSSNYNIPQTIELRAKDDCLADGTQTTYLKTNGLESADLKFHQIEDVTIPITVKDSDDNLPNIYFSSNGNLETSELGTNAFFKVKLSCPPTGSNTVSVPLVVSDPNEVAIDKQTLVFNADNYNDFQTVVLTGLSDCVLDGNKNFTVTTGNVVSADNRFDRYHSQKVSADSLRRISISGVNKDVAVPNTVKVSIQPNALAMSLNFSSTHPDEFITFNVSLTCPVTNPVNFGFQFITTASGNQTSPVFATVENTPTGNKFLTFSSNNWAQEQNVLIKFNSASITASNFFTTYPVNNLRIKIFQSDTANPPQPVAQPFYDAVFLQPQITY